MIGYKNIILNVFFFSLQNHLEIASNEGNQVSWYWTFKKKEIHADFCICYDFLWQFLEHFVICLRF